MENLAKANPLRPGEISKRRLFEILGYQPHAGQVLVHRSRAKRRLLACGVRFGKSTCAAMEAVSALLEPRASTIGWVVAPSYELANQIFRRAVAAFQGSLKHRVLELDMREQRLVVLNFGGGRSELRARSADNPVSLLGEGLDFVIVDEAARLKPEIWESYLAQRLIDRDGWALFVSTPAGPGWFHEAYRRGQRGRDPECASWNSPSWANPHLDRAVIEAERARLPPDAFAQEFGGQFIGVGPEPCEGCGHPRTGAESFCILGLPGGPTEAPRCEVCARPLGSDGLPLAWPGIVVRGISTETSRMVPMVAPGGAVEPEDEEQPSQAS